MPRRRTSPPPRRRSRAPLLAVAGAVVLAALAVFVLAARTEEAPVTVDSSAPGRVVVTTPAVDLGRVPLDVQIDARYELVNTGGKEVRLLGEPVVKTLEGC